MWNGPSGRFESRGSSCATPGANLLCLLTKKSKSRCINPITYSVHPLTLATWGARSGAGPLLPDAAFAGPLTRPLVPAR